MTKEELKTQVSELVDAAWDYGHAEGANEAAEAHAKELAELQEGLKKAQQDVEALRKELNEAKEATETAYINGYTDGHRDALNNAGLTNPTEDDVEPQPTPEPVEEICIEHKDVTGFMADQTYYEEGFGTSTGKSVVDTYIKNAKEGSKPSPTEQPAPILVQPGTKLYEEDGTEASYVHVTEDGQAVNFIPGKVYRAVAPTGEERKFKTTGTVRMIWTAPVKPYVVNLRDVGGYKCEGGHIAYGKLIRSAFLPKEMTVDSENAKILTKLGVTQEISVASEYPARNYLGWPKAYTYSGVSCYTYLFTRTTNIKAVINRIVSEAKTGMTLLHCHAGADRTGSIVALILGVCGVSEGDIIKDWEFTSFSCWFNRKRISDWDVRPELQKESPEGELRQLLKKLKSTYGTKGQTLQQQCESYLTKKLAMTAEQIDNIKKAFIVKDTK